MVVVMMHFILQFNSSGVRNGPLTMVEVVLMMDWAYAQIIRVIFMLQEQQ